MRLRLANRTYGLRLLILIDYMKNIEGQTFSQKGILVFGVNYIFNSVVENSTFEHCSFGYNKSWFSNRRDTIENSRIENCKVTRCSIGPAIVRNVSLTNLRNDMLICWGTLFDELTLTGKFGSIMVHGIPSGRAKEKVVIDHANLSRKFYSNVKFALDISQAHFKEFCLRTNAIPLHLIRRDVNSQFIVSRPASEEESKSIEALPLSSYTKIFFALMRDDKVDESLLVAPKLDQDLYTQILKDAEILEKLGIVK